MGNNALARRYRVSSRWVYKIRRQRAETGEIAPRRGKTGPKPIEMAFAKLKALLRMAATRTVE
ncbi:MAG: hypothetical protein DWQ42_14180 [Planctomycetota bacterium]|nr:MAG: hypothetical protein DWQ42_14180 [Planctomycetota bacterium]REK45962.1 MAG: hypothetical protein DWQ46_07770 [Planctomycetota bacterium]